MIAAILLFAAFAAPGGTAKLTGQVTDPSGASVPAANVTLTGTLGSVKVALTDQQGHYSFDNLAPGTYTVRASATGFGLFEKAGVTLNADTSARLDIPLIVTLGKQEVTVSDTTHVEMDPSSNVGAVVLKGDDLDALSDDPDDMQNDLEALAGPAAGPNGGQIYIDGFTGGRLPPKESIREVRINQNPFSSEYDKLGFGRIEVFTKPGTDKFRGQAFFNFGDAIFNSRNPFAANKPPYQQKMLSGNVSGPISKKASFFLDAERRDQQETSVINALTLQGLLNEALLSPVVRSTVSPRIDYQLTTKNTLVGRYTYSYVTQDNQGIGVFTLPTRAYNVNNIEQSASLTDTQVVSATVINETRFQYLRTRNGQAGNDTDPGIQVLGAFTGGGTPFGLGQAYMHEDHYEIQNYTSMTRGTHMFKFGVRVRDVQLANLSTQNYYGSFTFNTLDAYEAQTPSQFSITTGTPLAKLGQVDAGLFAQDDWRLRPNFTLSLGLRYETQNNIGDHGDFAPRAGFAWGLGNGKTRTPKTVIRGGFGLFYDRFNEDYVLQALQLNGIMQQQYVITSPGFYPNVPCIPTLNPAIPCSGEFAGGSSAPLTIRRIDSRLRAPYTAQGAIGVERQLPKNITLAMTYTHSRGIHTLRSRNINAPLPGTFDPLVAGSGTFPYGDVGNIYLYESSGLFTQNQLITNVNARINAKFNLFGYYVFGKAESNTDGAASFPSNQYNEKYDWGRAGFDVRHRMFIGGSLVAPLALRFSPFIIASSGQPFDITLGRDLNGDTLFNDRPALATNANAPGVVSTRYGLFDTNPQPGEVIVPRNYGDGPGMFSVNMRLSRTFGFGEPTGSAATPGGGAPQTGGLMVGGPRGGGGRGGGGMRGGGGPFGDALTNHRYNITLGISARNLFNRVNLASPIGNLSSPLFGTSNALAGGFFSTATANRRIEMQLRFSF
ncbi:MAG: TonB-dependent receptor [Bryobacteraceae bacterium]